MTISLINQVTEKDRINYIKVQIRRILCLPFTPTIFADARFWVEQLFGDDRKEYDKLIWEDLFYEYRFRSTGFKIENSELSGRNGKDEIREETRKIAKEN
jgi:hypothetical protein